MGILHLDRVHIAFNRAEVVRDVSLEVADGELVSLLGPSGVGKTSLLKAVAGLLTPARGDIRIDGRSVLGLPPERRSAVMVFQRPLLFPFMNVGQNIAFGLRMQGVHAAEQKRRIGAILDLTRLTGLEHRKVHEISGGEQQRVALARALVLQPAILLLDEPLSNLDAALRQQMRELVQDIQTETRTSMLFVTHDQSEALMVSHRVGVLLGGRLRQVGTPRELFHHPADVSVARFLGGCNFFEGRIRDGRFDCALGSLALPAAAAGNGHLLTATVRPEDILVEHGEGDPIPGRVRKTCFEGTATRLWVDCRGVSVVALTQRADFEPGQAVTIRLPTDKIRIFPRMAPNLLEVLPAVQSYVTGCDWAEVPVMRGGPFAVAPLAQGEYNLNYLLARGPQRLVLRVNVGTQIGREDQVVYEYRALRLLERSGATPRPHFVDDTRRRIDRGILVMEFLPGEPLDYRRDTLTAAALFARIHQVEVPESHNHLIRETAPLSLIFEECDRLLRVYFESPLAVPAVSAYLREVRDWCAAARASEAWYQRDPWPCIVNTEVNSGNFIVNRAAGTLHLVDWEMPRWGDPSQDLTHFCSPLTTLWKTDYRMSTDDQREFLGAYRRGVHDRHLRDTLPERIRLREPFVRLRGIAWTAMAWTAYRGEFAGVKNPDTWRKLQRYMDLDFIRTVFDPFIRPQRHA